MKKMCAIINMILRVINIILLIIVSIFLLLLVVQVFPFLSYKFEDRTFTGSIVALLLFICGLMLYIQECMYIYKCLFHSWKRHSFIPFLPGILCWGGLFILPITVISRYPYLEKATNISFFFCIDISLFLFICIYAMNKQKIKSLTRSFLLIIVFSHAVFKLQPLITNILLWICLYTLLVLNLVVSAACDFSPDNLLQESPRQEQIIGTWKIKYPRRYPVQKFGISNWRNTLLVLQPNGSFELIDPAHSCLFVFQKWSPKSTSVCIKGTWEIHERKSNVGIIYDIIFCYTDNNINNITASIMILSYQGDLILNWTHTGEFNRGYIFVKR